MIVYTVRFSISLETSPIPRKVAIRRPKIEMQARPRSLMIFAPPPTLIVTRIVEPASITRAKTRMAYRILARTASLKVLRAITATFPSTGLRTGPSTELRTGMGRSPVEPFNGARERPFDWAQGRPFDWAQD